MVRRVEKNRNAGAWSEARYWQQVRSSLRRGFRYWKPILQAKEQAKRPKKNGGRQKWEYQCKKCKKWWKGTEVQVDHIIPVGSLRGPDDLIPFLDRLTAEKGYQVLCSSCHKIKTMREKNK